jgi:hypothetical protein
MNSPLLRALPLLAVGLWGCSDDPELVIEVEHQTLIEVDPSEFLGTVPCLAGEGSMSRYVATLIDTTDPAEPFVLPSSPPIPCNAAVGFSLVVPGHTYAAEVDGYARDDLEPLAAGVRDLVDPTSRELVTPRWTTVCGRRPADQVIAVEDVERVISSCEVLEDTSPPADLGAATIDTRTVLGSLSCGDEPGEVARFSAKVAGSVREVACGETIELSGLSAQTATPIELSAFEVGGDDEQPRWGALCTATPVAGVTVAADCAVLSDRGAVEIDLPALLEDASLSCDDVQELRIVTPDEAVQRVSPPGCSRVFHVGDLPRGRVTIEVETTLADGSPGVTSSCTADVTPGFVASSVCQAEG